MFEGYTHKNYHYEPLKNALLKQQRGIGFDDVVELFQNGFGLALCDHHNLRDYPHQKIIEVDVAGYVYCVPCIVNEDYVFLKTIFPSRKATRVYKAELRDAKR